AEHGLGHTRPNPPVGAVIVQGNQIIGEGYHQKAGADHAEVAAIKRAAPFLEQRKKLKNKQPLSMYVTLEPCSTKGKTPACTDAIIAAGIDRVVYAVPDPNPKNRLASRRVLAAAGIRSERFSTDPAVTAEAEHLIRAFDKSIRKGIPYITVKIAMTLDGKICDNTGCAKWVSSEKMRKITGRMRETVDAVMVGAETIRKDDPSLLSHGKANPDLVRVVISSSGNLPKRAQIFVDGAPNKTVVYPNPKTAVRELAKMGVNHVLCEGGLKLAVSLSRMGLVDEWITVLAPKILGDKPIREARFLPEVKCLLDL
ncbi:MAG: bifunctional diaminohydroxyphosphoribosylaminopyrimidine deaminase/5-amino-6-(5-phosphoribosylamino)uracil reductase RibD, partial [Kiritimatiellae bacterium]|nr:bifunctional diaminohydroxyphosphoribosylaminopyrimidine deaminase/5-amino-6-(5-phosphoribosylamino)uracil reductase RibD [Kiritimatiellia bacterium]